MALDLGYSAAELRRASVVRVFLIATGMYHGGRNVGKALGIVAGDKPDSQ